MNTKGIITELKGFATHDGPGIRTTVFCKGCPLYCRWCANPETIHPHAQLYVLAGRCKEHKMCEAVCPEGAIRVGNGVQVDRQRCTKCLQCVEACPGGVFRQVGREMSVSQVLREVEKDRPFYGHDGGVTLSGGEPLFQPDFAISLLRNCRERGISTVLDTSGYAHADVVEEAVKYTDLVLLDIKHMSPREHRKGTGVDNGRILKNAMLMAGKTRVRISVPLIPGYNDSDANLAETSAFAVALGVDHVDVNPMHGLGADKYRCLGLVSPYGDIPPVTVEDVKKVKGLIGSYGLKVTVGRMM